MRKEEEFVCAVYFHSNYGKLAEIGFSRCYYSPDLEYKGEKGTPEFLLLNSSGNASCIEFKGHQSSEFTEKIREDLEQYKKYRRIVCKENSNSICNTIKIVDISFCYLDYWLENYSDDIIKSFSDEKINPIIWRMEKVSNSADIFIQDVSNNHTIASLKALMYEGFKTSERNIHVYTVVDFNTNDFKLNRVLSSALLILAGLRIDEFDLKMLINTLKSNGIILANNQELYDRIISRLNTIFTEFDLVKPKGENRWFISVDITSGRSRTSWTVRLRDLLNKHGDQSDLFRFTGS